MAETYEAYEVRYLNRSVMPGSSASESDDERAPILRHHNKNKNNHDDSSHDYNQDNNGSDAINNLGSNNNIDEYGVGSRFFYVVVFFVSLGGFLFGYDTGVVSGALIPLKRVFDLSIVYQQVVVSVAIAGAIIGAWLSGLLNDVVGRRVVLLVASFLFTVASVVLGAANGVAMLIAGRAVVGVGIGLASMTVPVYLAETAPPKVRGQLVTIYQLNITAGQFIASLMNGAFSYLHTTGWRFMLGISAVPSLIMMVGCWFAPESPRWLIQNDKLEDARNVLHSIRKVENVDKELNDIKSATATEVRISILSSLKKMLLTPTTRRALLLGCGLQMFQQLSAINTVMYYSASIIQLAGVEDENLIIWLAAAVAFGNCFFTLISFCVIEKMGRRKLTLTSVFGVFIALLVLAVTFFLLDHNSPKVTFKSPQNFTSGCTTHQTCSSCVRASTCGFCYITTPRDQEVINGTCLATGTHNTRPSYCDTGSYTHGQTLPVHWKTDICPSQYAWLAVCAMVFYLAMFAPGLGPMPWTINAEIYPLWARNAGTSAATSTNWMMNLLVSLTFLSLMDYLTRPGVFVMYGGVTLVGFVFLYVLLPETKGRKLEDIEDLFVKT